ncbi:MAG: hypothetical protein ACRD2G_13800, partial [Terriglobia bacterium]
NYARYVPGASTVANTQQRRPNQDFGEVTNAISGSNSSYNGLQVSAERRATKTLSLNVNYTWSKSIDEYSSDVSPGQSTPIIPTSLSANRGLSDFDLTNRFVASYVWNLPMLQGSRSLLRNSLGGWETTGIVTLQSGFPFSVLSGVDNSRSGDGIDYADLVGNPDLSTSRSTGQLIREYFNTAAFAPNALGTFGTAPRNLLRGPDYADFDFGLMKNFLITEKAALQFRAEFFNLFNRPNFGNPSGSLNSRAFGTITSAGSPRIIQFALKVTF